MKQRGKNISKILIILLIILISYIAYVAFDIYNYGNKNELNSVDAAIILGAVVWEDKPSPVFEERIKHGIWLYKEGYAANLIFTGGVGEDDELSEAGVAKNYAIENLVPEEKIFIEEKSAITEENIQYAAEIAKINSFKDVIIVSDPLHMKRAMLMAEDYGLIAYSSPTPTTRYMTFKSKVSFLSREVFFYLGYQIYGLFE
ncbi:YdcF family protein [Sedimentibacter sp.]|uniref:YdcF family protein n=1 Tax=Sedimentibacter sp. TaxID=1960295 RepID=UPI000EE88D13|nr:YdcF family protein [Sedimentibacter sp.]HCX62657.1 YdcF family protein [Clostridiales bacterium]